MSIAPWLLVAAVGMLTAHTAVNALLLRRPDYSPATVDFPVSVLLPLRDEAHRVAPCLESLLAQRGLDRWEIVALDDDSTDGTAGVVRAVARGNPRVRLVAGPHLPPGWLGKPHACHQLASHADARSEVLVFVDADVVLAPRAVASAIGLLKGFDMVSAYPRLIAGSHAERLFQPLLPWSWLTFLPMRAMERSRRPMLAAAGGQLLVVRRDGYRRAGGHAGVRDKVIEDVALARAVKRSGGRISLADGSRIAACRMYGSRREVVDGYAKSLWAAFGSPVGAAATVAVLLLLYTVPPLLAGAAAALGFWTWTVAGVAAYVLGVLGRVISGRATGAQVWPDSLTHPLSVALLAWLVALSYRRHRRGGLSWKGRPLIC